MRNANIRQVVNESGQAAISTTEFVSSCLVWQQRATRMHISTPKCTQSRIQSSLDLFSKDHDAALLLRWCILAKILVVVKFKQ